MRVLEGVVGPSWRLFSTMSGARWVQEGFESKMFASWRQDGKIKPPKMGPGWRKSEELGGTWRNLEEVGSAGVGGVVQQGGGI